MKDRFYCPCGFPSPKEGTVFYNDRMVYACFAFHPITRYHVVVVWKEHVSDINDLPVKDYLHFMKVVYRVRKAQLRVFEIDINEENIYLVVLNEARHVHLHLVPRRDDDNMGFELLSQPHGEIADVDLSMVSVLRSLLSVS